MPTYIYRTYPPSGSGAEPREFELEQSIHENTLITDPETGFPVKRVIKGGHIYIPNSGKGNASNPKSDTGGCCGGSCGCH